MRILSALAITGAAAAVVVGVAPAAFAATAGTPHTVASVHAHTDTRAAHITTAMRTLSTRVAANKHMAAASRTMVQADIAKVTLDTANWKKAVDAAATTDAIKSTTTAQRMVTADLAKLRTDRNTVRTATTAAHKASTTTTPAAH